MAGSTLVKQAVAHGHEVTEISRSKADLTALKEQIAYLHVDSGNTFGCAIT